jgi:hypothetical protein
MEEVVDRVRELDALWTHLLPKIAQWLKTELERIRTEPAIRAVVHKYCVHLRRPSLKRARNHILGRNLANRR